MIAKIAPALVAPLLGVLLAPPALQAPRPARVEPASDEAERAIARFLVPEGFRVSLFAAEPRLANPVSFALDPGGECYVAETFRHHDGVTDVRSHMEWCDADLAARTVEDRVALLQRFEKERFAEYSRATDRVRWLRDADGDGVADEDRVFATGFDEPSAGIGAGLLAHRGDVWFTCIPKLWLLKDRDRDGVAEEKRALHHGYGVHIAMLGHDLHGLRIGYDGRLWFSCGDRGLNVETEHGRVENHHTGAVLRCDLDGSNLEVFATGLRNPQELVFDEFGNLFTGDNNSDGGDRARWVHVIEGSDSGWRYGYQWITTPILRGPWNDEKLWHPHHPGQAAYLLPPLANLGAGPSGLTYHPGTGFPDAWRGHFFLCEFEGDPRWSGIFTFRNEPKGATFAPTKEERFLWNTLATDCDFGPDGALWWSDWVRSWEKTGKGRIYRLEHPSSKDDPATIRTRAVLRDGMVGRPEEELERLLAEPDQRVRQEAHLALAARGAEGTNALARAVQAGPTLLARIHALWGLAVAARAGHESAGAHLLPLLADPDSEIRAQAARAAGDLRLAGSAGPLVALIRSGSARERLFAAIALGRLRSAPAVPDLVALLAETGASDPALRHGLTLGLAGCASEEDLAALAGHASSDVRIGAVVALRRQGSTALGTFLVDPDPHVAEEAARAAYDLPLVELYARVAALLDDPSVAGNVRLRRALAASLRIGDEERARSVARFALRDGADEARRIEALALLASWNDPPERDPVMGEWRPVLRTAEQAERTKAFLPDVALEIGASIEEAPTAVRAEWIRLVARLRVAEAGPRCLALAEATTQPPAVRAAALRALSVLRPEGTVAVLRASLLENENDVRAAALDALRQVAPEEALSASTTALRSGGTAERRAAYGALAGLASDEADRVIEAELERLAADLVPPETALELLEAARARLGAELADRFPTIVRAEPPDPAMDPFAASLHGGDAALGRELFRAKAAVSCLRCHVGDDGEGGLVGPDLRASAATLTRRQIVEAIVDPNRRVAPGYEGVILALDDDRVVTGRIEREDARVVVVRGSDNGLMEIPASAIVERAADVSAMPDGLGAFLSPREMRDLVEYLATLRAP